MGSWPVLRGRVYAAKLSNLDVEKYFLIVSNNSRNRQLESALAIRLTTSRKPSLASIVTLDHREPFKGSALCDDILELYKDEILRDLGALSPAAMASVGRGLIAALGL